VFVLGISCHYHDAAAALLQDGLLVAAAEEERFSRKKHDHSYPQQAIAFCLEQAGITSRDLDYVVFYEKPLPKFERVLMTSLHATPYSLAPFREAMISWLKEKLWVKSLLIGKLGIDGKKVLFVDHHVSHAASALFCSPFEEAAIITADGVGEWTTTTVGRGRAPFGGTGTAELHLHKELRFPHSLGLLYSAFTSFLGFEVNEGEYKVMGMAPYGEPRFVDDVLKVVDIAADGSFQLDMRYFAFHRSTSQTIGRKFLELFGEPRHPEAEFITRLTNGAVAGLDADLEASQRYADIAASVQQVTEEVLLRLARHAYEITGLKQLCLAGGVALNSVANGRILREGPFDELFIQPAAGDSGGALGAALYAHHILLGQPRRFVMEHAYWGKAYGEAAVVETLRAEGARFEVIDQEDRLVDRVVERIEAGDVVGWYQGGFEWGPRALGHRSIIADPRRAEMKELVNRKIKFREPFRPFAPSVLAERASEYFEIEDAERQFPARFMLLVAPVRANRGDEIAAVNHLGTARLQAVRHQESPRYYRLIEQFGQATGTPMLLNTSFNLRGEPIVNTPANALHTFHRGGMELLVMDNVIVHS